MHAWEGSPCPSSASHRPEAVRSARKRVAQYRTTPREATQQSPYSLVYGMEAVTHLELVTHSFRIDSYNESNNSKVRTTDLDNIPEIRERAQVRIMEYQRRIKKAFDKTITPTHFQQGDLVLHKVESTGKKVRKLDAAWEGPF
jgi:hypothetical protein